MRQLFFTKRVLHDTGRSIHGFIEVKENGVFLKRLSYQRLYGTLFEVSKEYAIFEVNMKLNSLKEEERSK